MSDLQALLARVEMAEGPDREIDCELEAIALNAERSRVGRDVRYCAAGEYVTDGSQSIAPGGRYTASLDDALALVERVLPGAICGVEGIGSPEPDARVITESDGYEVVEQFEAAARTPTFAVLAALLKALIAQAEAA